MTTAARNPKTNEIQAHSDTKHHVEAGSHCKGLDSRDLNELECSGFPEITVMDEK